MHQYTLKTGAPSVWTPLPLMQAAQAGAHQSPHPTHQACNPAQGEGRRGRPSRRPQQHSDGVFLLPLRQRMPLNQTPKDSMLSCEEPF